MPGYCKRQFPFKINFLIFYGYRDTIKDRKMCQKSLKMYDKRKILKMIIAGHLLGEK